MTRAKLLALATASSVLVAGAVACSSSEGTAAFSGGDGSNADAGKSPGLGDGPSAAPPGPTATGVLLVHAAAFPAFRLCFENFPDLPPQPDESVMPEANVVGVEVGSLVRVDPMAIPGKVYVIAERKVRANPGETHPPTCGERVAKVGSPQETGNTLTKDNDYHVATVVDRPLGQNKVSVLAISGCGSQAFLNAVGLSNTSCGTNWDTTTGNLQAKVVDLSTSDDWATPTTLPVQLFQLSQALDVFKGSGALSVTFGDLAEGDAGALETSVPVGKMFEGGKQTTLVHQTEESIYGTWGFRVTANTFKTDQSLAAVQELSSPRELPTTYYQAASNYALLLLGDPTHTPTLSDGSVNTLYNPRQSVHILAVPVIDPSAADAGADGGATDTLDGGS